jgi:hypothetical protein
MNDPNAFYDCYYDECLNLTYAKQSEADRMLKRITFLSTLLVLAKLTAQQPPRPPSTPLITHNPYFSIWSNTDDLTASSTVHWTGKPQPIVGLVRVDGHPFRFMGGERSGIPALHQVSRSVTPTHTRYVFNGAGIELELSFFTPTILSDLDILSRPVTYVSFTVKSIDGAPHKDVSVLADVSPLIAVKSAGEAVRIRATRPIPRQSSLSARASSASSTAPVTTSVSTGDIFISPFQMTKSPSPPSFAKLPPPPMAPMPKPASFRRPTTWTHRRL